MKDTLSALIFIMFLYVSFCLIKTDRELQEEKEFKQELVNQLKQRDSINTMNIQDHKLLMNRIEFMTKKSGRWK